jgi:hypothetical protein
MSGFQKEYIDPSEMSPGAEEEYLAMKALESEETQIQDVSRDMRRKYRHLKLPQHKRLPNTLQPAKEIQHRTNVRHSEATPEDHGTIVKRNVEQSGEN